MAPAHRPLHHCISKPRMRVCGGGRGVCRLPHPPVQSCDPNLDVRVVLDGARSKALYRLCLFACKDIPTGVELCYDYHYTPGTIPGLVVVCACGAQGCKGRLL